MKSRIFSSVLALFIAHICYADTDLDNLFSNLPKNVSVTKTECSIKGQVVEPWRLDSFHIQKDSNGIWGVTLVVDTMSATQKISSEFGKYVVSYNSDGKRLDMDVFHGPGLALIFSNSKLELDQLHKVSQFSGPDLIRKCVYQ